MPQPAPPPYQKDNIPTVTISSPLRNRFSPLPSPTLKTPRTARFAEATAVNSPIEPKKGANPFKDPPSLPITTNHYKPQPQISDIGFGYLNQASHEPVEMEETDEKYLTPMTPKTPGGMRSPLKSALKSPGAAPRNIQTILSPTFQEEETLEKAEKITTKEQKRDLRAKIRVRWAKFILRGVNFSCSLIVLSMLSTTFSIFNATRGLAPRNNLPAWAPATSTWPQILLLSIACVSLFLCILVFWGYYRGGHRRAEKIDVYYTTFAVAFFVFSIVMWVVGAAVLNESRNRGNGQDMWGWSCKENKRKQLFQDDVSYALVCRLQSWSLICCIIEVVVEVIAIIIYGITFYRYYTKRRLRKTMAVRDKARSDMYLAQLKLRSAPNTPGLPPNGLLSPRDGAWMPPQGYEAYNQERTDEKSAEGVQFAVVTERKLTAPKPFALQAPPSAKKLPRLETDNDSDMAPSPVEMVNEHVPAAPGEAQYETVAIPGAYQAPTSPVHQTAGFNFGLQR